MRPSAILVGLFLLSACKGDVSRSLISESEQELHEVPNRAYDIGQVFFNKKNSLWLFPKDSLKVSGYIIERYIDGTIARKFGVVAGRRQGQQLVYFPNGDLRLQESFKNNRLDGEVKRWTKENGYQLVAQLRYREGRLDGEQKKWYSTGELHKLMHMSMGRENGLQQAFRKNGALYANYEARNGRVFGLKRSNLCYELDNEQVVYRQ